MAEIDTKRIINLPDQSGYNSGDYVAIDNATNGTHRFPVASMVATAGQTVAPEYDATSTYAVGDFVIYDGLLYCCSTAIETAEAWTAAHWTQTNVGDEIAELKNDLSDGTFIVNNAENAQQLTSTVGIEDTAPYLFRTSGGSNDIGDREDVRKIVGGTIVNNQLIATPSDGTTVVSGITKTIYNDGAAVKISGTATDNIFNLISLTFPAISGHKYIFINNYVGTPMNGAVWQMYIVGAVPTTYEVKTRILQATSDDACNIRMAVYQNAEVDITMDFPQVTDLTLDLGAAIADYVYSLETATAGAGVAWLKKHFPAQFDAGYQAYDAGSLQSVSGLTAHKMVGFNQWDEEWELGIYDINTGAKIDNSSNIRNKNLIRILPNTQYCWNNTVSDIIRWVFYDANKEYLTYVSTSHSSPYVFTTPANACYMAFYYGVTSYSGTLCINLHWDGERDGEYEPYVEYTYPLDDSLTLRGIPKVDAHGNLYYDGDEYLPDGTVNRRWGIVDMGTLVWGKSGTALFYSTSLQSVIKKGSVAGGYNHIKCVKYVAQNIGESGNLNEKCMSVDISGNIQLIDNDFASQTSLDFKNAMNGVMLIYELATPTTETADPYQETQIVDDFGTEEFILADGAFPVPVGHNTMYQNNLRAKLEMSPDSPDGDGLYVVQQENGQNEYVPLASTSTIQDILTRLTALENA